MSYVNYYQIMMEWNKFANQLKLMPMYKKNGNKLITAIIGSAFEIVGISSLMALPNLL